MVVYWHKLPLAEAVGFVKRKWLVRRELERECSLQA